MTIFFPLNSPNLKLKLWKIDEKNVSLDITSGATEGENGVYMSEQNRIAFNGTSEQVSAFVDGLCRELKPQSELPQPSADEIAIDDVAANIEARKNNPEPEAKRDVA